MVHTHTTQRVEFFYMVNPSGQKITFAYTFTPKDDKFTCKMAFARCGHGDNFVKKLGRDKASGRLNSLKEGQNFTFVVDSDNTQAFVKALVGLLNSDSELFLRIRGTEYADGSDTVVLCTDPETGRHYVSFE